MIEKDKQGIEIDVAIIIETLDVIERRVKALKSQAASALQNEPSALDQARQHYNLRRNREQLFGHPDLFGEPAWDMLVDLFIAAGEGKKISVSSMCIAASVPSTTALRWISLLENRGLIDQTGDALDARRSFLALSSNAYSLLGSFFGQCDNATFDRTPE